MDALRQFEKFVRTWDMHRHSSTAYIYGLEKVYTDLFFYIKDKKIQSTPDGLSELNDIVYATLKKFGTAANEKFYNQFIQIHKLNVDEITGFPNFSMLNETKLYRDLNVVLDDNLINDNKLFSLQSRINEIFTRISIYLIFESLDSSNKLPKRKSNELKFEDFFNSTLTRNQTEILKDIFNENNSPLEYAVMASLLCKYDLIEISHLKTSPKNRKSFYRSIYKLMNKSYTRKESFNAIAKHLEFNDSKLVYKIHNDPIFIDFEKKFKSEFLNNI
ncbi:hypothetical protein [uncultured Winogradskyella sp.]|uniref:hypothetical protein n=1 Tax=uncultured Winogradskyella sp. TaxID=395353 RepID=UPI003515E666